MERLLCHQLSLLVSSKLSYEPVYVDEVLRKLAVEQGKRVQYEMPSGVVFAQFMTAMPQKAQSQYIEWLLDFFEDRLDDTASFDWMKGDPLANGLDRMRAKNASALSGNAGPEKFMVGP